MKSTHKLENIRVRPADQRGHADHGWLDSYFTFSFADYYDPAHMGFRTLRVINEDVISPGQGFAMHPHNDMEIFTYVIEGALKHRDSMGHESTIKPGQAQKITAGTGILHSEFNASQKADVHLLQIWITPAQRKLKPSYQEITLPDADAKQPLVLIGSPDGAEKVMQFNQDVFVYRGILKAGQEHSYDLPSGRGAWIQMVKGEMTVNGIKFGAGDGASLEKINPIHFQAQKDSKLLFFDLK